MELKRGFSNTTKQIFWGIDVPLFAATAALCVFGILNIYGIGGNSFFFNKQLISVAIGLAAMIIFSFFNYRYLKNYSLVVFVFYIAGLLFLMSLFLFPATRGVQSWISIGALSFEPAELMKLVLIVLMAKYFSQRHAHINDYRHVVVSGLYCLVPAVITLAQPDLGSAMIIVIIWLGMILAAGINKRHLFILFILGLIVATAGWLFVLKPYQKVRIESFLNPDKDAQGSGYNLIQSKIAIGAGGLFGHGWGEGPQSSNGFLPEPYNDFIFASVADQFGLVGTGAVLAAVLFVIGRRATSNFGKLFALGMAILISAHVIIAAGVNVGLMPVTGLPFPFISYGGSNMLAIMIGLGILQSIKRYG